jgi:hypothetical protein
VSAAEDAERAAGWRCREAGRFRALLAEARAVPPSTGEQASGAGRQFRWSLFHLRTARNEKLGHVHDPSNDQRRAWRRAVAGRDLTVPLGGGGETSFLVVGDPGEGDASQFAVVEPLLRVGADTAFMVIASDVVYPAGDVNDYRRKLYFPYRGYRKPIYAVPGNHDWDDGGLFGFMYHFCGVDRPPAGVLGAVPALLRPAWRRPAAPDAEARAARAERRRDAPQPLQPFSYFALDAGPVMVVGVDHGLHGMVDRDQAAWLARTARASAAPKILVTGKPIYANAAYTPGPVEGGGTLDAIVRDPRHRFVAVVSGEVHNYQRHTVAAGGGRTIQYIVSGGGGAFMKGTHTIPRIDLENPDPSLPRIGEGDVRMYPRRGDSLSFFSQLYAAKARELGRGRVGAAAVARLLRLLGLRGPDDLWVRPAAAAAIVADRLGLPPPAARAAPPTAVEERAADVVRWLPHGGFSELYYPYWDWDEPPFFKSFLRVDASSDEIRIRCFGATGCAEHEADPPVEDDLRWTPAGGWRPRPE